MKPLNSSQTTSKLISLKLVAVVTLTDGLFFSILNPSSGNSTLIIIGSGLLAAGVYAWCALMVRLIASFWPFAHHSQRILAIFVALSIMFLILMQSIGQLSWRDILAVLPLAIVLYLYMSYRTANKNVHPSS